MSEQLQKRLQNRNLILRHLLHEGPKIRADIANALKIRPSSVSSIVDDLLNAGLVTNVDPEHPRSPVTLNTQRWHIAALSHQTHAMTMGLFSLAGELLTDHKQALPADCDDAQFLSLVYDLYRNTCRDKAILMFGAAVPGIVDVESGEVLHSENAPYLTRSALSDDLSRTLGVTCCIENDVRASLFNCLWREDFLADIKQLIYIEITAGIGSAILIDGEIYRGTHLSAGEIGHIVLPHVGKPLEHTCALPALSRLINGTTTLTGDAIADAMQDQVTQENVAKALSPLLDVLAPMIRLLDPECIVLGNQVPTFYQAILPILKEGLKQRISKAYPVHIKIDAQPENTSLRGAAALATSKAFQDS